MSQTLEPELELEQEPLSKWISTVVEKGRQMGHSDNDIKGWVRTWAKSRNYHGQTVNKLLRRHGIRVYNRRPVIGKKYPKLVICPKCVSIGTINVYYPNGEIAYVIRHEKIPGTWGKDKKVSRWRRCYIFDKENLKYIEQKLEFYTQRDLKQNPEKSPEEILFRRFTSLIPC